MNYPVWDQPAAGLLIAAISILHVFISHFAVGGGLFLVLTERKARRENDAALLDYVKRHSRFFLLLTLVLGAVTGVGIWFAIALVHPTGTSSLITTFVWGWAIEWTFFITEIAAAMVYYYGWERLDAKTHQIMGWIYFIAAWMSLVIINGIVTFMLTPGDWVTTRGFWDGFFNPTYWPSLFARTFVSFGLAGLYAFLTNARSRDLALKAKVAAWAGWRWVMPMAIALPLSILWYLAAAAGAGVPVGRILGNAEGGVLAVLTGLFTAGPAGGYPPAQTGALIALVASIGVAALTVFLVTARRQTYGLVLTGVLLLCGIAAFGGGEWVREDLRKPYVIGGFMFTNGVRLPAPDGVGVPPAEHAEQMRDRFTVTALDESGVLGASLWLPAPEGFDPVHGPAPGLPPSSRIALEAEAGERIFKQLCFSCHTTDGYLALQPLVAGQSVSGLEKVLESLARPVDVNGEPTAWNDPHLRLRTRLARRMPPFVGTDAEKRALAVWLARLGGADEAALAPPDPSTLAAAELGATLFEDSCAVCHSADSDWPIEALIAGKGTDSLYDALGRLDELNEMMDPFDGSDEERHALAAYLAGLAGTPTGPPPPDGAALFEDSCALCHGPDNDWPIAHKLVGRDAEALYELLGDLQAINSMMPPFEGSEAERRALAAHLASLGEKEGAR